MNTKLLMALSGLTLMLIGIVCTFLPQEIIAYFHFNQNQELFFQVMGALYFGFGVLNWMAKGNVIGGIYSKPIAIGNFAHFFIGGIALIKYASHNLQQTYIVCIAVVYLLFAVAFGWVQITTPKAVKD